MSENATPRTDAAEWIGIFTSRTRNISLAQQQAALRTLPLTQGTVGATAHVVYSQFSRNLERELTAANARIAELEKDAARYRVLRFSPNSYPAPFVAVRDPSSVVTQLTGEAADRYCDELLAVKDKAVRETISAAMSAKEKP